MSERPDNTDTTTPKNNNAVGEPTKTKSPNSNRPGAKGLDNTVTKGGKIKDLIRGFAAEPIDTDNDVAYFEMTGEKTTYKTITSLLEAEGPTIMGPLTKPTKIEVIKFKRSLGDALLKCRGAPTLLGGHIYLILNKDEYRKRVNKPKANLPSDPEPPTYPKGGNPSAVGWCGTNSSSSPFAPPSNALLLALPSSGGYFSKNNRDEQKRCKKSETTNP